MLSPPPPPFVSCFHLLFSLLQPVNHQQADQLLLMDLIVTIFIITCQLTHFQTALPLALRVKFSFHHFTVQCFGYKAWRIVNAALDDRTGCLSESVLDE